MKGILILSLLGIFVAGQAQVIQLEEATVSYSPRAVVVSSEPGKLVLNISEEYKGQFASNPIKFVKESFDIVPYITSQKQKFDSYVVDFKSNKGNLVADFDKKGNLVRTIQKFKNGKMPVALRKGILLDNAGWSITNYKYVASGKKDRIDKEAYKIKLVNNTDGKTKTVTVRPQGVTRIASN